jgi:predicted choloylglycine hydrolase
MAAWPGMIGVLSGMNEKGVCLANMEVKRNPRWPNALPYTLLYRSVLEQCSTLDGAISLLQKSPRQTANNLMLIDADGNRAVAEITPEAVHVRRAPANQALVCTNHQRVTIWTHRGCATGTICCMIKQRLASVPSPSSK